MDTRLFRILLLLLLPFGRSGCAAIPVQRGELHGQIHWQNEVHIQGDLVLAEDAELTIAPGTRVLFLQPQPGQDRFQEHPNFPGSELIVRGRIIARGTAERPIRFAAADRNAAAGSWGGINIEGSPHAQFEFCIFQQADSALHTRESWVSVENSWFHDNLVGIRFHDTDFLIERNLLERNGAAIRFHFGAPVICRNLLRNNDKGLFITAQPRDYRIEHNSFLDNRPYQVNLGEGVRQPVQLANNYWGQDSEESLPDYLYDGRLDDWLGTVEFLPLREQPDPQAGGVWNR